MLVTGRLSAPSISDVDESQCYPLQDIYPVEVFVATSRTVSSAGLH